MNVTGFKKLFSRNSVVYIILIALCLIAYINIFGNEFTVVDDLPTFVNNETIRSIATALKTFQLQLVIYSIFYALFGANPIPVHILSIVLHIINTLLLFTIIKLLFTRKVAIIAAVLFAVHPINTEAVTWISGNPYLFNALIFNLSILSYILYKRTKKVSYLRSSIGIFIGGMLLIQTIWLITIPIVIGIIEQFIIEKKFNLVASKSLVWFFIPLIVFGALYIGIKGTARLSTRSMEKPMNQQSLKPIVEGGPYTIFTMSYLYIFPKDLMIYYDGNPITTPYYVSMYIFALLYGIAIVLLWNKNRSVSAILIILAVLLAPTYSPVKVSWYLSERYLYIGTGFFTTLLAFLMIQLEKRTKMPIIPIITVILLIGIYTARTLVRNADYKNSQTLAIATINTSPVSIRGYDDLAGDYLLKGNYKAALPLFRKTLSILPNANTAVSNLGYIYVLYGIPQTKNDLTENRSAEELQKLGVAYYKRQQFTNAFYYLYQATILNPQDIGSKIVMADIYVQVHKFSKAEKMLKEILLQAPDQYAIYNKLAYVAFQSGKYDQAEMYLNEVLKKEPNNKNAHGNLLLIKQAKLQKQAQ